jgi:uncharacterized repeat protein (TIGR02543 family)
MLEGGAVHAVKTVSDGTAIGAGDFPANPARSGYSFAGWNTQPDGAGNLFTASTAVSADITVYAQWTEASSGPSYTVTFMLNDGTVHAVRTVSSGAAIDAGDFPANPARSGYSFAGWNTQLDDAGSAFTASTTVSAHTTVYAQWDTYSYMVTFEKNGGDTEADPVTKTVTGPASNVGTLPANPVRSGYSFAGWNT